MPIVWLLATFQIIIKMKKIILKRSLKNLFCNGLLIITLILSVISGNSYAKKVEILNVSYDPTRELYEEYNQYFIKYWKGKTGQEVKIKQSHGGSGKQARSVIDGLQADIVTLALGYDIDMISEKTKLLSSQWQKSLPLNSSPYTSTIVFLVKKGNPKNIKDWDDLAKKNIEVITPNPKTSGGARWNYMGAWAYADKKFNGDEVKIKKFLKSIFDNVVIYDTGARGSTITFVQRGIGDVLISWENEAFLATREFGKDKFEIIVPSISMLAEPPVAVVDNVVKKHKTEEIAKAYLEQLYTPIAQEIIAKNFYRPTNVVVAKKYKNVFLRLELVNIKKYGGWKIVQKKHFDDGGIFDQISKHR